MRGISPVRGITTPTPSAVESFEDRRLLSAAALSVGQVAHILAQAASQARNTQAITVVDRQGNIQGIFAMRYATADTINKAAARARTAAFFQSQGEAFTTRTARFIIQDHFPPAVPNH